ncbi:MAG: Flp pilus assembly protein CpaB [Gammaproteobacteria bacterium]|nr:MAG: Flp pilus assembly protein CpaB [Gammaproteobacteria bacterium]
MAVTRSKGKGGRRNLKPVLMFILSLALGAVGVFFSRNYIEQQIAQYKSMMDEDEELVRVVVPTRPMMRGEVVIREDLAMRPIPAELIDQNSIVEENLDNAFGRRLEYDIAEGVPLLWAHLEGGYTPTFSGKVENGLRAMTVRVDEINSISGFLQPKDKVDLLLSYGKSGETQIFPLIQKLNVIATGIQTMVDKQSGGQERSFNTITVHVSPEQAQKITLAQNVGKLTAVLRNPEDEGSLEDSPMTIAHLLNLPEPKPVEATKRSTRKPKKPAIEYIVEGR